MIIQQILEIIKVLRKLIFLTMKTYFTHISMDMDVKQIVLIFTLNSMIIMYNP